MKKLNNEEMKHLIGGLSCIDRSNGNWALLTCPGICVGVLASGGMAMNPGFCL